MEMEMHKRTTARSRTDAFHVVGECTGVTRTLYERNFYLFIFLHWGVTLIFCPGVKSMTHGYGDFSRLAFANSTVAAGSPSSETLRVIFGLSEVIFHIDSLHRKKGTGGGEKATTDPCAAEPRPLAFGLNLCVCVCVCLLIATLEHHSFQFVTSIIDFYTLIYMYIIDNRSPIKCFFFYLKCNQEMSKKILNKSLY